MSDFDDEDRDFLDWLWDKFGEEYEDAEAEERDEQQWQYYYYHVVVVIC